LHQHAENFANAFSAFPTEAQKNGINTQNDKFPAKKIVLWHLKLQSHIQATEEAHAACVEAQFPSLPETQSLPSPMPRAARVSAALQATTSPPPALDTSNTSLQHPFLHSLASGSSFPQLSSVHVLPALLKPSGDLMMVG